MREAGWVARALYVVESEAPAMRHDLQRRASEIKGQAACSAALLDPAITLNMRPL
jgi:hypothetical protein